MLNSVKIILMVYSIIKENECTVDNHNAMLKRMNMTLQRASKKEKEIHTVMLENTQQSLQMFNYIICHIVGLRMFTVLLVMVEDQSGNSLCHIHAGHLVPMHPIPVLLCEQKTQVYHSTHFRQLVKVYDRLKNAEHKENRSRMAYFIIVNYSIVHRNRYCTHK